MKLTEKEIAKYRPPEGKADHIVFDETLPGFGLRFRDGKRTWLYQYATGSGETRINGRLTLGAYPALSPAKARSTAEDLYAKVRLGQHPAAEKKARRIAAGDVFGKLVTSFLRAKHNELKAKTRVDYDRYLNVHAASLHGLPLASVDLRRIASLLDTVANTAGTVSANRARSALSAMFVWALQRGMVDANPVAHTEKLTEKSRDRVLTDGELAIVWNSAAGPYGDVVRLLALTGQRASEIGGLRWSEVDLGKKLITLPAERTKNGRPHEVPLSTPAVDILKAHYQPGREFVFGGRDRSGFNGWGQCKIELDKKLNLKPWRIHDLRRTCATGLANLGHQPHVVEAVLNHVSGSKSGVAGIYNKAQYSVEKAQALNAWAGHVLELVGRGVS
jgi:integrase